MVKYKGLAIAALVLLVAAGCNKQEEQNTQSNTNNSEQTQQQNSQNQQGTDKNENATDAGDAVAQNPTPAGTSLESDLRFSGEPGEVVNDQPQVYQIDINSDGFYPKSLKLRRGDYIQFVNKDTAKHWPASGPHPQHTALPGFDPKKALATNEKFTFEFTKAGEWSFHDHLNPSFTGVIIVQ